MLFLLVAIGSLILSSCLTIEEKITLKADGSGVHASTIDFGSVLDNPLIKMGLEEELKKQGQADFSENVDSTFRPIDELLEMNPQWTDAEKELLGRIEGHIVMNFEEGEGYVTTTFPFNNVSEVNEMQKLMENANKKEGSDAGNPFSGLSGSEFFTTVLTMKGTKLVRTTTANPDFVNPLGGEDLGEEGMEMVKMMFGEAVVAYTVEFPGEVKKVKGFPGHDVEGAQGNVVTQYFDFMDMLERPEIVAAGLTGEVKFKK
ncbi:MAG: hypothetical protein ACJAZ9_000673 [Neolewinella sp.]|jgi:hypothetical protein